MISLALHLDYQLAAGWLQPWAEGILRGEALARLCTHCARVSFAPLRSCDCGCTEGKWIELTGDARILSVTEASDGMFGLVRFDGADTNVIARLSEFNREERRGRLVSPGSGLPAVVLKPADAVAPSQFQS